MNSETIDFSAAGWTPGPGAPLPYSVDFGQTASWFQLDLSVDGTQFQLQPGDGGDLFFTSDHPFAIYGSAYGMSLDASGLVDLSATYAGTLSLQGPQYFGPVPKTAGVSEPQDGGLLLLGILAAVAVYVWTRKRSG